ncbi:MAG: rane-bound lytic murein transglycosylase [Sphingomonadales bacterium]|jgi:membrane-bound lytic murein transglycosylase A|nr:rane-bound lytic murein transglycosylase [Sphingomonadales bacterium]
MARRESGLGSLNGAWDVRLPLLAVALVALSSCTQRTPPPAAVAAVPDNALSAGVTAGPDLPALDPETALRAQRAFLTTCPALLRRQDASGLTRPADWQPACAEAATAPTGDGAAAERFFRARFELVQVGDGGAFATGYYEPQIAGSRTHIPGYDVPIYAKPPDLVETDAAAAAAAGTPRRGRTENGVLVPYYERAEIEDGALAGRGLEIAWAADPVDFFFLQIQGSGRLLLPDGSVMRIGYAGQNGREYVGIGRLMRERSLLEPGHATMQDIKAWLRDHPDEGKALMREDKSYIFFQELTGAGPLGALGLLVTPRATVAADPKFVPLGVPVLLQLDQSDASGLWVAQDTGGAIRGRNRFDTFWGSGEDAARIAGGLQARGRAWLLVPKGTLERLHATAQH